MIIDTSALVAVVRREPGHEALEHALLAERGLLLAPVLLEFRRVTDFRPRPVTVAASILLDALSASAVPTADFTAAMAEEACRANLRYGTGNGRGGTLNMLDLMVYAAARVTGLPILCTGHDFAATDALIHPASRPD